MCMWSFPGLFHFSLSMGKSQMLAPASLSFPIRSSTKTTNRKSQPFPSPFPRMLPDLSSHPSQVIYAYIVHVKKKKKKGHFLCVPKRRDQTQTKEVIRKQRDPAPKRMDKTPVSSNSNSKPKQPPFHQFTLSIHPPPCRLFNVRT